MSAGADVPALLYRICRLADAGLCASEQDTGLKPEQHGEALGEVFQIIRELSEQAIDMAERQEIRGGC